MNQMDDDIKDPFCNDENDDLPSKKNTSYKHDTIVNLYNDIKIYDKEAAAQASEIDDSIDTEVREEILKSTNNHQSMFRRPVLLIVILIIAVAIFILCPFLQLASVTADEYPKITNNSWNPSETNPKETINLVQLNNLWDG